MAETRAAPGASPAGNATVRVAVANQRHVYQRGEEVALRLEIAVAEDVARVQLRLELDELPARQSEWEAVAADTRLTALYRFDASSLRPGDYELELACAVDGTPAATLRWPVIIVPQRRPLRDRLPIHWWGDKVLHLALTDPATYLPALDFAAAHGYSLLAIRLDAPPTDEERGHVDKLLDEALRRGMEMAFNINTFAPVPSHPEALVVASEQTRGASRSTSAPDDSGHSDPPQACAFEPAVRQHVERAVEAIAALFHEFPAWAHAIINSGAQLPPCYSPRCLTRAKDELGFDPRDLPGYADDPGRDPLLPTPEERPPNGTLATDDLRYRFYRWYWQQGQGDVAMNELVSSVIKRYRHDVMTWAIPGDEAPLYGRGRSLGGIGQRVHTTFDPKHIVYMEYLRAAARPESQRIMPDVALWNEGGSLVPGDRHETAIAASPDHVRECYWLALSRQPDLLCHSTSARLNPLRLALPDQVAAWEQDTPASEVDPRAAISPETHEEIGRFSREVLQPLAPLIKRLQRPPRRVALLDSGPARLYGQRPEATATPSTDEAVTDGDSPHIPPPPLAGWTNERLLPYYTLFWMAHTPCDVIFDETLERQSLDGYDVLALFRCEVLPQPVHDAVRAFQRRGGIVVTDQWLGADLPGAVRLDFDFGFLHRQQANVIEAGDGITAVEAHRTMGQYAQQLRETIDQVAPHLEAQRLVDSTSPDVVLDLLEYGPVQYIFVVNDRRAYDERVGRWRAGLERGRPLRATVQVQSGRTLHGVESLLARRQLRARPLPVVYDLLTQRRVRGRAEDRNRISLSLRLEACEGKLLALYPEPIERVTVVAPPDAERDSTYLIEVRVLGPRGRTIAGLQPIRLEVNDARGQLHDATGHYAAENGYLSVPVRIARNDQPGRWGIRITDLTTGHTARATVVVA